MNFWILNFKKCNLTTYTLLCLAFSFNVWMWDSFLLYVAIGWLYDIPFYIYIYIYIKHHNIYLRYYWWAFALIPNMIYMNKLTWTLRYLVPACTHFSTIYTPGVNLLTHRVCNYLQGFCRVLECFDINRNS